MATRRSVSNSPLVTRTPSQESAGIIRVRTAPLRIVQLRQPALDLDVAVEDRDQRPCLPLRAAGKSRQRPQRTLAAAAASPARHTQGVTVTESKLVSQCPRPASVRSRRASRFSVARISSAAARAPRCAYSSRTLAFAPASPRRPADSVRPAGHSAATLPCRRAKVNRAAWRERKTAPRRAFRPDRGGGT